MSSGELFLTLLVALLVFGPSKLPMLASHLGQLVKVINRLKFHAVRAWHQQLQELQLQENQNQAAKAEQHYQQKDLEKNRRPAACPQDP